MTSIKPWLSKAAAQFREQCDDSFPERMRQSDGWLGDVRHSLRVSDHNPDPVSGVVRAIDIDARLCGQNGLSADLADQVRLYGKNTKRIGYVIHLGQIASPLLGWKWRKYKGINQHNHHMHISFSKASDNDNSFFDIPLLGGKI
jgi:hypothetical protein